MNNPHLVVDVIYRFELCKFHKSSKLEIAANSLDWRLKCRGLDNKQGIEMSSERQIFFIYYLYRLN